MNAEMLELVKEFFSSEKLTLNQFLLKANSKGFTIREAQNGLRLYLQILGVLSHDGNFVVVEI